MVLPTGLEKTILLFPFFVVSISVNISMKCVHCQKETENPKFCSRSCAASYTNKQSPKRKLTKTCSQDGCECIVRNYRSRLCEFHFLEMIQNRKQNTMNSSLGELRGKNKHLHASSLHAHVRALARSWFKDLTKLPCACCGYDKHVELCHIKSLSSFSDDALVSEANHKDNIVQLCPNCHWELDNGFEKKW
jgi:hypothetical protein